MNPVNTISLSEYEDAIHAALDENPVVTEYELDHQDYLADAHPEVEENIMEYLYQTIPLEKLSDYLVCVDWAYEIQKASADAATCSLGEIVRRLYTITTSFPNIPTARVMREINDFMILVVCDYSVDERWRLFHHIGCDIEEGDVCSCGMDSERVLQQITIALCKLHNQRISPLSMVWSEVEDSMVAWLPREMIEDVVWLNGGATVDTMLVCA